jgi:hypothetical protein
MRAASVNRVDLYMRNSGPGITHTAAADHGRWTGPAWWKRWTTTSRACSPASRWCCTPAWPAGGASSASRGDGVLCTQMKLLGEHRDGTFAQFVSAGGQRASEARRILTLPRPRRWA